MNFFSAASNSGTLSLAHRKTGICYIFLVQPRMEGGGHRQWSTYLIDCCLLIIIIYYILVCLLSPFVVVSCSRSAVFLDGAQGSEKEG